jgi:hypothetical protein
VPAEPTTAPPSDDRPWDLRLRDELMAAIVARQERRTCTARRASVGRCAR